VKNPHFSRNSALAAALGAEIFLFEIFEQWREISIETKLHFENSDYNIFLA